MSREQKILDAAEKLFSERSFDGVGIDAIGKEAGIVGSGVYRHFNSKQDILATLMDKAIDALLIDMPQPSGDPHEDLRLLVQTHVDFALGRARLADIWQREHHNLESDHRRRFARRQHQYIERWVTCLEACYPGNERDTLLAAIRAMHVLMSSDTTRRQGTKPAPNLAALLSSLTLSALEGLAREPSQAAGHSINS